MRIDRRLLVACLFLVGPTSQAADPELALDELDEVLIVGTQAGPALWQVKSGTHVLWVLATPPLVSKDLKWRSKQVEKVFADTQEVLAQYGTGQIPKSAIPAELRDGKGNLDRRKYLALVNQTRYLPDGQSLRDMLPPDVRASFEAARSDFPVRDRNLEKEGELERSRPEWARNLLARRARLSLNLAGLPVTDDVVRMAKRRRIKVTSVEYQGWTGYIVPIPATIESAMNMCALDAFLQGLEGRGARWKARANAWAAGNVKRMKELLHQPPQRIPDCEGNEEGRTESGERWLAAMERSLANNPSTLAVVDAALLLSTGGLLDELGSRGYEVVEP